jgi:hypothetical protein
MENAPDPEHVLFGDGLVEVHLSAQPLHHLNGSPRSKGEPRRIAGDDTRDDKDYDGETEKDEYGQSKSP